MSVFLQPIYTQTVGAGGASSITFTNIPQTFTDLQINVSLRSNASSANYGIYMTVNNNGSSIYSYRDIRGDGNSVVSQSGSATALVWSDTVNGTGTTSSTFSNGTIYIPNYANSTTYKSALLDNVFENNSTNAGITIHAGLISSTSAITTFSLQSQVGNFVQYSTVSVYGILCQGV